MQAQSTDVFALAEKRLDWIDQRQAVLAQNIANVNTPGYQVQDVKPFGEVLAAAQSEAGRAPLPSSKSNGINAGHSLDGNAVTLDEQLEKVAETDTAHQLAMNVYRKYMGMFKTAIGRS